MQKHLVGFALFFFIVVSSVLIFGSFYYWKEYEVITSPKPHIEYKPVPYERAASVERVSYVIKSFNIDMERGLGTVEMALTWSSDDEPPAGLRFDLGVATADKPLHGIQVGSCYLDEPFAYGRTATKTCEYKLWGATLDPKVRNYYGYAEVADRDNGGSTKLVQIEKNRMIGAVPALVKHSKKK